ncbi:hypothetical protein UA08_04844 [Talaromyces atroroseus]|uniref:Uncharacterized protein n=1 Tax=Talaromyces atroroseus TaxID=1441469 RepID=A0A225AL99_TALAT|nr:hypothetical protein UA08_04844 [Talaromyces atroroseus]OKL60183.1 hypothetical protein UA08_04844 [Talaromyces atroroseus]
MDRPTLHSNFTGPFADKKTTTSAATATTAATTETTTSSRASSNANANANVLSTSAIQYDHETYLELLAGQSTHVEKTASQVYREERARKLSLRAQDPAVLTGPLDLEIDVFGGDSTRYAYMHGHGKGDANRK